MTEQLQIRLDENLQITPRKVGGQSTVVAYHAGLQKYFHFGTEEAVVLQLIDGHRSAEEILHEAGVIGVGWSAEELTEFFTTLMKSGVATIEGLAAPDSAPDSTPEPDGATPQQEPSVAASQSTQRWVLKSLSTLVSVRIPIMNFDGPALWLAGRLGWLFHPASVIVWIMMTTSAFVLVAQRQSNLTAELTRLFDQGIWLPLLVIWVLCKVWHEVGHAVAARRQGVRVGQTGIMFFLFAPLAYVDVTNAWKLPRRFSRMQIALAGVYFELGLASVAAWGWCWLPVGMLRHLSAQVFLIAGPATLLVNANPLLRLDGYFVLSDLADIPNLRSHGRGQLGSLLERIFFGVERPRSLLNGWRRPFATLHAFASVVFQVAWMSGLVVAVSMWAHGLGVIIAIAATILWALLPLTTWSIKRWRSCQGWSDRRRLVVVSLTVISLGYWGLSRPSPLSRRVPVVVRYQNEQLARASADAFVMAVHVTTGQQVQKGDLLMELQDENLQVRRDVLADELSLARQHVVVMREEGKLVESDSARELVDSLKRQLNELQTQIKELVVVAKRDGVITSLYLERLVGRYVDKGGELIRVSDPNEKELVVSVDEDSVGAYGQAVLEGRIRTVRFRGGQKVLAKVTSLRPRATRSVPHPALAASAGGPLAIEPGEGDESMRTIHPRMQAVCQLSPVAAGQIRSGQIGSITIGDDRSIGNRLIAWVWREQR